MLLIDRLNGVLRRFQHYFSHITATAHIINVFLGFTSTRLGTEVSCPRTLPLKNPEDPVRLERVEHFTTEPRGTLYLIPTFKLYIKRHLKTLERTPIKFVINLTTVRCKKYW